MNKKLNKIINFGYKVSEGDNERFAYFLQNLRASKQHESRWRDLVVNVISELPIDSGKQVLKAILENKVQ